MADLAAFLAGDHPEHVAVFLSASFVDDADTLAEHGERVEGGVALVVEGDRGRRVFRAATGLDVMSVAGEATQYPARVAADLSGGDCPSDDDGVADATESGGGEAADRPDDDHRARFVFAFAEAQDEAVGDLYAEGDVIHAYAVCECGQAYSDRWVAGTR